MDIFLVFYVLGLMMLFFFMGAAIGGAARSFKSYLFGVKDNEFYCCEAQSAKDDALVANAAVAGAALGSGVAAQGMMNPAADERQVVVEDRAAPIEAVSEWQSSTADSLEDVEFDGSVVRDETADIELEAGEIATPLNPEDVVIDEGAAEMDVVRAEPPLEESVTEAPAVVDEALTAVDGVPETDGETQDVSGSDDMIAGPLTDTPYEQRFDYDKPVSESAIEDQSGYEERFSYSEDEAAGKIRESHRLFGKEERAQREASWRERYNGDNRRIIAPAAGVIDDKEAVTLQAGEQSDDAADDGGPYEERFAYDGRSGEEQTESGDYEQRFDYREGETVETTEAVEGTQALAESPVEAEAPITEAVVETESPASPVLDDGDAALVASVEAPPIDSDDLQQIKYISTGLEKKLNLLGVYKLSQIAQWSGDDIDNIAEQLEMKGKIEEEGWVSQAQSILDAAKTETQGGAGNGGLVSGLLSTLSELDKIEDMSEHEKTMLSNNGVTSLSQIANWSGRDMSWVAELLDMNDLVRVSTWVSTAKGLVQGSSVIEAIDGRDEVIGETEDDLKRIRGIDAETEARLKEMGVKSYAQIADFEQADMDRVNDALGTSGRVERQYWVVQAKVLRDGGETDFSKLYDGSV